MQDCLFFIGEDGTAAQKRVDIQRIKDTDGQVRDYVYGLCGGRYVVESLSSLIELITAHQFATTLYVVSLIPLVDGAPCIPIIVLPTDNTFTRTDVHQTLLTTLRSLKDTPLEGKVIGDVSDGDSKLRSQVLSLSFHKPLSVAKD